MNNILIYYQAHGVSYIFGYSHTHSIPLVDESGRRVFVYFDLLLSAACNHDLLNSHYINISLVLHLAITNCISHK